MGTTRPVLVEHKCDPDGRLRGFTDNYIPVSFPGPKTLMNTITAVSLESVSATQVNGRNTDEDNAG